MYIINHFKGLPAICEGPNILWFHWWILGRGESDLKWRWVSLLPLTSSEPVRPGSLSCPLLHPQQWEQRLTCAGAECGRSTWLQHRQHPSQRRCSKELRWRFCSYRNKTNALSPTNRPQFSGRAAPGSWECACVEGVKATGMAVLKTMFIFVRWGNASQRCKHAGRQARSSTLGERIMLVVHFWKVTW